MRIGVDIRTLMDKNYSGVSLYTLDLAREILKQDRENEYFFYYNSGRNIIGRMPKFEGNVKMINTRYPNKIFNYILQKIFKYPKLDKILSSYSRKQKSGARQKLDCFAFARNDNNNIDVFFSPHINFTSLSSSCKKILTIHDLSFLKYSEFFSWRKRFWHWFLNIKKIIKGADLIVAVSENTKNDIIDICGKSAEKIKVIYPGISKELKKIDTNDLVLKKIKEKYNLPEKFVFYLGTIEPRKNIESLIEAFDAMADKDKYKNYNLIIAGGSGWKNNKVFDFYNKAKNKSNIKFLGYIKEEDKIFFYNSASLFVFPSFYEGFGFPPLEAQSCGAPVIASNISSLSETLGASAILIDPNNVNQIQLAMEQILSDNFLRDDLIKKGLKNAERFNWEKAAGEYIKIFNNLK